MKKLSEFPFSEPDTVWKSASEEQSLIECWQQAVSSSGSETLNPVQVQQLPAEASGRLQCKSQEQIAYESKYQELVTFHQSQEALDTNL